MSVNFRDPLVKEHSPKVMPQLVANLQAQVGINNQNSSLTRKLRFFLLAVQSLAQTQ